MKKNYLTMSMKSKHQGLLLAAFLLMAVTVFGQPTITSFSPAVGPVGTLVTITGTNLSSPTAFTIGGINAIPISNSGTSLVALVMPGATTGAISVTTASGTGTSSTNFIITSTPYPYTNSPQGGKIVGTGYVAGNVQQGYSVAISADGNTAAVGGNADNGGMGAVWVYTRSGSTWTQQGSKLVGTGNSGNAGQGWSVALSADGNTLIEGGENDHASTGAAWVFTRSGGTWTQLGSKLVSQTTAASIYFGQSAALSADGNTAVIGGSGDGTNVGAVWVFTQSGGVWTLKQKLVGTGYTGTPRQGTTCTISADGLTIAVGAKGDSTSRGAVWIFYYSGGTWAQQGSKLVPIGGMGLGVDNGSSVALSADGNTLLEGAYLYNSLVGAAWVFTRSGSTWSQQAKLSGSGETGAGYFGWAVSLSADGNTAIVGDEKDSSAVGSIWLFTRTSGTWTQQGTKIKAPADRTGTLGSAPSFGAAVALSADGRTGIIGGFENAYSGGSAVGAVWPYTFTPVTPAVSIAITAGAQTECAGSSVTFTATPTNGGTAPYYNFIVNGSSVQNGTSNTYTSNTFNNNDSIWCVMTSNNANASPVTATSTKIFMTVNPLPQGSLTATSPACSGGNGQIIWTASTGTGPYTVVYNDGVANRTQNSAASGTGFNVFTNPVANTTYTLVSVTDANTCVRNSGFTASSATINVTATPSATANASGNASINNATTYTLSGSVANNSSYSWSATGGTGSLSNTGTLTPTYNPGIGEVSSVTITLTANANSPCITPATSSMVLTVTAAAADTWIGNTTDWFTASNWTSNTVPNNCNSNLVIPALTGRFVYPVLVSAASAGNLTINNNAQLTLNANLSLCGNLTGGTASSAVISGSGTPILSGSSDTLSGMITFKTLTVNNGSGKTIVNSGASVNIDSILILQSGTLNTSAGTVTLVSTAVNQIAVIDNFSTGNAGTISGNVVAQRYYNYSLTNHQHLFGSPVNTPNMSQLNPTGTAGYIINNYCDEVTSSPQTPYGTLFSYDETHGTHCALEGWQSVLTGTLQNAQGYSFLRTDSGTLNLVGAPNLNASYSMSGLTNSNYTNTSYQGRPMHSGFNLMSNPYSATLNISSASQALAVANGFGAFVYVWNDLTNQYTATTVVAPFQAFLVNKTATGGTATYTVYGSDRVATAANFYKQTNANALKITATNTTTNITDETTVAFNADATDQYDPMYDAYKLPGGLERHTLYSMNNNRWMEINVLHSIQETGTVPVGFEPGASGTYSLSFNGISGFDPTSYITLEDKKLNVMYDVRNGAYKFTADAKNDGWDRFVLHFTPAAEILTNNAGCNASGLIQVVQPGSAVWNYTITDHNNMTIAAGTLNQDNPVMVNANVGLYTLTLIDNNGYTVVKNIQVSGNQPVIASFNESATVAQVQDNVVLTSTTNNATNYSWNFGDGITANGLIVMHSYQNEGVYNVSLAVTSSTGCNSTTTQTVTITPRSTTGIGTVTGDGKINVWSNANRLYVDFSKQNKVEAQIDIYNVLGQEIYSEKYNNSNIYNKQINNVEAGYIIVRIKNNDETITKKVFIDNVK